MRQKRIIFDRRNSTAFSLFELNAVAAEDMIEIKKILVIDDELDICLLLSGYLKKAGHEVIYTTTLQSGVEIAKQLKPSVIFLDHNLPDGLGIAHIHTFKGLNCEVCVISALSNLKEEALKNGADHFFEKPLSLTAIKAAL